MKSSFIAIATVAIGALLMLACRSKKEKVVWKQYPNGQPQVVFYFDNNEDAALHPSVEVVHGISHANKPISFGVERYYSNGQLYCKGQYVKGQTCGLWQYYYSSGIQQAKCYYWNGITRDTA
jgi:antitoxin component YwqK of YwqJK toxin-antitoxin module